MTALTKEQATQFNLNHVEIEGILTSCSILSDFEHTSILTLRKLDRNIKALLEVKKEILAEGAIINQRAQQLNAENELLVKRNEEINRKATSMQVDGAELLPLRDKLTEDEADYKKRQTEHNEAAQELAEREFEVDLFTIPISEFPEDDRSKFPKKQHQFNPQVTKEVDTVTAFLSLIGTIIIE